MMVTSVFTAIGASLCCITPVLALIAGASGIATIFSWLEPFRPFLAVLTVGILGFAWYRQYKQKEEKIECNCEDETGRTKFFHSKKFLGIITVFAAVMLTFPYYAHTFYPSPDHSEIVLVRSEDVRSVEFTISGMTCQGCAAHVEHEVNKLSGIIRSEASYEKGNAVVEFDNSKTSIDEITQAINSTGYVGMEIKKDMLFNNKTEVK